VSRILITSALPYINGNEVLLLCGTDEHGTPAELAAVQAGLDVAAYCARQHAIQADIYSRFSISFDHFSRTSGHANHALTREFYHRLDAAGLIEERTIRQPFSVTDGRFLQDRLVEGICPHCGDSNARGRPVRCMWKSARSGGT
jgi:methionyl-tRNA synthetase